MPRGFPHGAWESALRGGALSLLYRPAHSPTAIGPFLFLDGSPYFGSLAVDYGIHPSIMAGEMTRVLGLLFLCRGAIKAGRRAVKLRQRAIKVGLRMFCAAGA